MFRLIAANINRIVLLLSPLILDDLGTAWGNNNKKSQLLDGLINRALVPKESHEDLAFQEHQMQQLITETWQFFRSLLLKPFEVEFEVLKSFSNSAELPNKHGHVCISIPLFIFHIPLGKGLYDVSLKHLHLVQHKVFQSLFQYVLETILALLD